MPEEQQILLEAKEIKKVYGQIIKTIALRKISLTVKQNDFIAIIGPSGCGKTNLANILGVLDKPISGEVYFQNQSLGKMEVNELAEFRNEHIGFIFQFYFLLKEFTTLENVLIPAWIKDEIVPARKIKRSKELLNWLILKNE
ncbi:MAG: ATP-binding cassette domain-containing protein [Atribacterota bacterium]|nr:ATP-binding cassette domain-containing protein [Atribacterota bacterium]MDD4896896.1 ATP-binding cassette domain-containing protein [Atribacterota bacterium]MDD5637909.1 ATP-binding cassette domain-containing protein [Atribacterota bacterium]